MDTLRAAVELAKVGFYVYPAAYIEHPEDPEARLRCSCPRGLDCPDPGKHPAWKGWQENASNDPVTVESWWRRNPRFNILIATGRSGLVVLDVDPRSGGDESLRDLEQEHGALPETVTSITQSGGEHHLFRAPEGNVRNSVAKLGPGLDIRANGGLIIAPPSKGLRGEYAWENAPGEVPIASLPEWILKELGAKQAEGKVKKAKVIPDVIPAGERNDLLTSLAGTMRRRGASRDAILAALQAELDSGRVEQPPGDEMTTEDIEKIADSIAGYAPGKAPGGDGEGEHIENFYAYLPERKYLYTPTRDLWPAASVNSRLGEGTAVWLDRNRPIEQLTWAPGEPQIIKDRFVKTGGWAPHEGARVFNLYVAPTVTRGSASEAGPWLDHVRRIYPDEAEHLIDWLAHRVQRPGEKLNHALVLGGDQGIGKDTLLEPVKQAVGPWNVNETSPQQIMGRFNGFVRSVILRVSEARDLGDSDRFALYEHTKTLIAAPPDVHRVDEKHRNEYAVPNVCGVLFTTNNKTSGLYIPEDDRRHFVAWSERTKDDFTEDYWTRLWRWYETGGYGHVAAYLHERDLSGFDPKAPPPKTAAWREIVESHRSGESADLSTALESLGWPCAVTVSRVVDAANLKGLFGFSAWLLDRRHSRHIPHVFEEVGYVKVRNEAARRDGLWSVDGKVAAIYAQAKLSKRERIDAARALSGWGLG